MGNKIVVGRAPIWNFCRLLPPHMKEFDLDMPRFQDLLKIQVHTQELSAGPGVVA